MTIRKEDHYIVSIVSPDGRGYYRNNNTCRRSSGLTAEGKATRKGGDRDRRSNTSAMVGIDLLDIEQARPSLISV